MKTSRLMSIILLGVALTVTPVYAQGRGGGGGSRGGGGSHSSSSSSSRGGGGYSSSSSSRGSSYSSGSSSRSSSYSGSSSSRGSSYSSSSSSRSSSPRSSSYSSGSSSRGSSYSGSSSSRGNSPAHHNSGVNAGRYSGSSSSRSNEGTSQYGAGRGSSRDAYNRSTGPASSTHSRGTNAVSRGDNPTPGTGRGTVNEENPRGGNGPKPGTPSQSTRGGDRYGDVNYGGSHTRYARPGHPDGHLPPSHRPIHPAPYFYHPYHHCMIHMRPIIWTPVCYHPYWHWPGFWVYCNSYWYDYHVTDVVVVHEYVHQQYGVDMVSYAISGDLMYAIVRDGGKTYMQVYDQSDKVIAEHEISNKYIKTEIDRENGGCWVFKKKDKDPLLFLYADGELLIYEAD